MIKEIQNVNFKEKYYLIRINGNKNLFFNIIIIKDFYSNLMKYNISFLKRNKNKELYDCLSLKFANNIQKLNLKFNQNSNHL